MNRLGYARAASYITQRKSIQMWSGIEKHFLILTLFSFEFTASILSTQSQKALK